MKLTIEVIVPPEYHDAQHWFGKTTSGQDDALDALRATAAHAATQYVKNVIDWHNTWKEATRVRTQSSISSSDGTVPSS